MHASEVIHSLADVTGMMPGEVRFLIHQQINDRRRAKLIEREHGLARVYTPKLDMGTCQAKKFDHRFKCSFKATALLETIPVCGRHRDRILERQRLLAGDGCDANSFTDRFQPCYHKATHEFKGRPVCYTHRLALSGSLGEMSTFEVNQERHRRKRGHRGRSCLAHEFTDRFRPCRCDARKEYKGLPVCGRHFASLTSGLGEMSQREFWRIRQKQYKNRKRARGQLDIGVQV